MVVVVEIKIPIQYNDSFSNITIDREEYILRFTYNVMFDYYVMGIYDKDERPISTGMKLVPNYPINHYTNKSNTPTGIFSLITFVDKEAVSTKEIKDKSAILVYIPYDELPEGVRIYEE